LESAPLPAASSRPSNVPPGKGNANGCKSTINWKILSFRTQAGREVDIVLEDRSCRIVGIEVKASATLAPDDLKGLKALADLAGKRFPRGIVLDMGQETIPFGACLRALAVSALWAG